MRYFLWASVPPEHRIEPAEMRRRLWYQRRDLADRRIAAANDETYCEAAVYWKGGRYVRCRNQPTDGHRFCGRHGGPGKREGRNGS